MKIAPVKLNIGGGKHRKKFPADWLICDKGAWDYQVDLNNQPLPMANNSIDAIYTSHTLEHLYADVIPTVMTEMCRVLKPRCPIRIVVPDIDIAVQLYANGRYKELATISAEVAYKQEQLPDLPVCKLASWFYTYKYDEGSPVRRYPGGHTMAFNFDLMRYYMEQAGFQNISRSACNTGNPIFQGCDFGNYAHGSLYVEACK